MSIAIRNCLGMYFHILMLDEYYLFVVDGSLIVNSMLIFWFLVDDVYIMIKTKKVKCCVLLTNSESYKLMMLQENGCADSKVPCVRIILSSYSQGGFAHFYNNACTF